MKIRYIDGTLFETDGICTDAHGNELGYLIYCRTDRCFPIPWICPKEKVTEVITEQP